MKTAAAPLETSVPATTMLFEQKKGTGLTVQVKVLANGALYRIEPMRYPREPRFWCVSVKRCLAGSMPDPDEPAWIGEAGLAWQDLAAVMDAIRADLDGWVAAPMRRDLRDWMLRPAVQA